MDVCFCFFWLYQRVELLCYEESLCSLFGGIATLFPVSGSHSVKFVFVMCEVSIFSVLSTYCCPFAYSHAGVCMCVCVCVCARVCVSSDISL